MKFLILNGPNLNLLGKREPEIYGDRSYAELCETVRRHAEKIGVCVDFLQSNHEGTLIDALQNADGAYDGVVFNPAGYSHTSVALFDAVKAIAVPVAEVHLSDPDLREPFRQTDLIAPACVGCIKGKGFDGYCQATDLLKARIVLEGS